VGPLLDVPDKAALLLFQALVDVAFQDGGFGVRGGLAASGEDAG
jgi:hypothetical protein